MTARFESRPEEKIFGMGQYQHGFLNQKNCVLELAQRNSQASVPFALSSLGYGFLWNIYPLKYAQGFYEGMAGEGQQNIVNLLRCAWAGSQRYGALVWSGDIDSSFESLRNQLAAGLNMGLAGIPWWTTDIGGFHGGVNSDPSFRECLIRWFQFATFSPVLRMHGDREPHGQPLSDRGGGKCVSGAPNELWSFGDEVYGILEKYLRLREEMRPYIRELMAAAHQRGSPLIRPLFYDFPADSQAWDVEDAYMFGPDVLVAPSSLRGSVSVTFTCRREPGG